MPALVAPAQPGSVLEELETQDPALTAALVAAFAGMLRRMVDLAAQRILDRGFARREPVPAEATMTASAGQVDPAVVSEEDWARLLADPDLRQAVGDALVEGGTRTNPVGGRALDDAIAQATDRHVAGLAEWGPVVTEAVRSEVLRGMAAGESLAQMAARVRGASGLNEGLARAIARTELSAAANSGAHAGWGTAGVLFKRWDAILDARVRREHAHADGQIVAIDLDFKVGSRLARYPGDPRLPAFLRANCRCTMLPLDANGKVRQSTLDKATRAQLYALAGQLGLPGRSRLRKGDLRSAIDDWRLGLSPTALDKLSRTQLLQRARLQQVQDRHLMTKVQLIQALRGQNPWMEGPQRRQLGAEVEDRFRQDAGYGTRNELVASQRRARAKATTASRLAAEAESTGRPAAGPGDAASASAGRKTLFEEFGGKEDGYITSPFSGTKLHWTADPAVNPNGYEVLTRVRLDPRAGFEPTNVVPASRAEAKAVVERGSNPLASSGTGLTAALKTPSDYRTLSGREIQRRAVETGQRDTTPEQHALLEVVDGELRRANFKEWQAERTKAYNAQKAVQADVAAGRDPAVNQAAQAEHERLRDAALVRYQAPDPWEEMLASQRSGQGTAEARGKAAMIERLAQDNQVPDDVLLHRRAVLATDSATFNQLGTLRVGSTITENSMVMLGVNARRVADAAKDPAPGDTIVIMDVRVPAGVPGVVVGDDGTVILPSGTTSRVAKEPWFDNEGLHLTLEVVPDPATQVRAENSAPGAEHPTPRVAGHDPAFPEWGLRGAELAVAGDRPALLALTNETAPAAYNTRVGPYTSVVTQAEVTHPADGVREIAVTQGIVDGRRTIGTVRQSVTTVDHGEGFVITTAYIDDIRVDPDRRAQGVATETLRDLESYWTANGVDAVHLNARGVGGYGFAVRGYDFNVTDVSFDAVPARIAGRLTDATPKELRPYLTKLARGEKVKVPKAVLTEAGWSAKQLAEVADVQRRLRGDPYDPRFPTPLEVAMVGKRGGADTWAGREAMIGATWPAIRQLRGHDCGLVSSAGSFACGIAGRRDVEQQIARLTNLLSSGATWLDPNTLEVVTKERARLLDQLTWASIEQARQQDDAVGRPKPQPAQETPLAAESLRRAADSGDALTRGQRAALAAYASGAGGDEAAVRRTMTATTTPLVTHLALDLEAVVGHADIRALAGIELVEDGLLSTSVDGARLREMWRDAGMTVIRVDAPIGTRLRALPGSPTGEVLLDRGTALRFVGVDADGVPVARVVEQDGNTGIVSPDHPIARPGEAPLPALSSLKVPAGVDAATVPAVDRPPGAMPVLVEGLGRDLLFADTKEAHAWATTQLADGLADSVTITNLASHEAIRFTTSRKPDPLPERPEVSVLREDRDRWVVDGTEDWRFATDPVKRAVGVWSTSTEAVTLIRKVIANHAAGRPLDTGIQVSERYTNLWGRAFDWQAGGHRQVLNRAELREHVLAAAIEIEGMWQTKRRKVGHLWRGLRVDDPTSLAPGRAINFTEMTSFTRSEEEAELYLANGVRQGAHRVLIHMLDADALDLSNAMIGPMAGSEEHLYRGDVVIQSVVQSSRLPGDVTLVTVRALNGVSQAGLTAAAGPAAGQESALPEDPAERYLTDAGVAVADFQPASAVPAELPPLIERLVARPHLSKLAAGVSLPAAERAARLGEVADAHAAWEDQYLADAPFEPAVRQTDANLHYVDVGAPPRAQDAFASAVASLLQP